MRHASSNRFHTMGLTIGLAGTICAGTTLVLPLTQLWPPSPADIVRSLRSTKVTTCIIVPLLLEQLVDALESDVSRVVSERFLPLVDLKLLISEYRIMLRTHCTLNLEFSWRSPLSGKAREAPYFTWRQPEVYLRLKRDWKPDDRIAYETFVPG